MQCSTAPPVVTTEGAEVVEAIEEIAPLGHLRYPTGSALGKEYMELYLYLTYIISAALTCYALKNQRMIATSIPLAIALGLASNYISSGLANASLIEIALRILIAYAILRSTAEITKRMTGPLPAHMHYSTQQPVIEFEAVS